MYDLAYEMQLYLLKLPKEYKQVSKFAWFPIRDPESNKLKWLRLVTLYYETQVGYYDLYMFPSIRFVLVKVEE